MPPGRQCTNVVAMGYFRNAEYFGRPIDFLRWCTVGLPLMLALFVALLVWMSWLGRTSALDMAGMVSPSIVLQTAGQNALVISDLPGPTGGIMLKSTTGATLIVNDTGIFIQNGKGASIVMTGPTVTINNGALVVV
jgi:hypothetical protein